MSHFNDFGLAAPLLKALVAEGYETPTPIQSQAVPHVMAGRDICGIAQTGTGKTAAFALPILHRLQADPRPTPRRGCRVLVLAPTRELASQIEDSFRAYGKHLRLTTQVVFGGVPVPRQERALANGADIVVATPGRLLDLVERRSLNLADVEILVLDEADQMLDLGFIHDLKRIVKLLPKKRQTLFFSATMPTAIATLADAFLTNPAKVAVAPVATTAERVEQQVIFAATGQKQALLHHLLKDPAIERVLVFTRTKHGANRVVGHLDAGGFQSAAIHGNKSQAQREKALAAFKAGECRVLVATDIAARGIDVDGVTHVINFDLPNVAESYVHRIGRTARAGAAGIAISFCNDEERAYLRDIERLTRQKVPVAPLPAGLPAVAPVKVAREEDTRSAHFRSQAQRQRGRGQPAGRSNAGAGAASRPGRAPEPRHEAGSNRADQQKRRGGGGNRAGHGEGRAIGWLDRSPAQSRSR